MQFESLETRALLSSTLAAGVLTINATNANDVVVVGKDASGKLFVTENGTTSSFTWAAVNKVVANLLAGADRLTTQTAVNKTMEVYGGAGNDTVTTGTGHDKLYGGDDNDLLDGAGGNDDTFGNLGTDTADYSNRTNNLNISLDDVANDGGAGASDNIHTDIENVIGGSGNDLIVGSSANNTLSGAGGHDTVRGMGGNDHLDGGVGGVAVYSQNTGNDLVEGGDGNDIVHASDYGNCTLNGNAGDDWLHGWGGKDLISGGDGNDTAYGGMNDDDIYGNAGNDYLYGEDGNDRVNGDNGYTNARDRIFTFPDLVATRPLQPITKIKIGIPGLGGATPAMVGPIQAAKPMGITGVITKIPIGIIDGPIFQIVTYNDYCSGGNGNDVVRGNQGNDTCVGGAGNDRVYGDDGNDSCYGDDGFDSVYGGAGNDFLCGGNHDDVIVSVGGGASDVLRGDAGKDQFWADSDASEWIQDADFWGESLGGTVHRVGSFSNGASKELNGQNLTDPNTFNNRSNYTPGSANFSDRPLFANNAPSKNDIVQGQVGDCYFLAGLSATAKQNGQQIKNAVADFGDGTYGVRFYAGGVERFYRVDGDLATYQGTSSLYYANLGTGQSIWVPILEKAFAFFRSGANSYNSLHGGGLSEPFNALGRTTTNIWSSNQNTALLNIKNALAAGKAVTALTPSTAPTNGAPAVRWHVYSVESVQTVSVPLPFGGSIQIATGITVRNPWGTDGAGNDGSNDGYVTMTAAQFHGYFIGAVSSIV